MMKKFEMEIWGEEKMNLETTLSIQVREKFFLTRLFLKNEYPKITFQAKKLSKKGVFF